jgi:hypothetical protein
MAFDGRKMVVYEYGRSDFENDLDDYTGTHLSDTMTDERWNKIQDYLQANINEYVEELIKHTCFIYSNGGMFNEE